MSASSVRREDSMKAREVNAWWVMGRPVPVPIDAAMASLRWSRG
ncbi:hypothetical protein [Myxococcus xanthus]|nr:hypothetical protein [Myxococcus xanthus]